MDVGRTELSYAQAFILASPLVMVKSIVYNESEIVGIALYTMIR